MADVNKMDRTWLCSVLFTDIANYSSQSVELQMKWKNRFNGYLAEAIRDVPESERVILDTGDGAAICFLGAPEAAMFAALELCRSFVLDEREQKPGLRVRIGINLGPVKLVKDINGALNAIGDGINAGQRIMSFASENQILVSQSYFEVVSRVSDDYKQMFQLKGVETDKHVREHTVYHLTPPGSEKRPNAVTNADGQAIPSTPGRTSNASSREDRPRKSSLVPWLVAGAALIALAAGAWHFYGSATPAQPIANATPIAQDQSTAPTPEPAAKAAAPIPSAPSKPEPVAKPASPEPKAEPKPVTTPAASVAPASSAPPSTDAKTAYDDGMRLIDEDKATEAARRFDDAIRAKPDYVDAYVGRAEARRILSQYDLSLEDCNKIIQLKADDPRGYNCRGFSHQQLKQLEAALPDFNEALRLNPNFRIAYEHRGTTYELLQQYDRAVQDYSQAIRLAPRNALFYIRRGTAYSSLKQYDKAIQDYSEAIRLDPNSANAYRLRALAEDASGDAAGAAADRDRRNKSRKNKSK
jgi:tetratricopeptide (TPR) repeat protein/class 3 adenylate cyclase